MLARIARQTNGKGHLILTAESTTENYAAAKFLDEAFNGDDDVNRNGVMFSWEMYMEPEKGITP